MKKEMVVIGSGKIGRGSVTRFFLDAGWKVSLYGHSMEKMRDLEAQGYYECLMEDGSRIRVEGFEILDCTTDEQLVAKLTTDCDLAAIALYEGAFPHVGTAIGHTIKARVAAGIDDPINFMLCVNAPTAIYDLEAAFLETLDEAELEYYRTTVGMCFTMVMSLGANPSPEDNPWLVRTSLDGKLEIDGDEWKGERIEVPRIGYTSRGRGLIYRKVFVGNMSHAMQGFIASAHGDSYMDEGINDDDWAQENVNKAKAEAIFAVKNEFEFDPEELADFEAHLYDRRTGKQAHDPISRVCNSPEKKISRTNRYIWPALKCLEHGRLPFFLARGTAYGLLYLVNGHGAQPVEAPKDEAGVKALVERFCGLTDDEYVLRDLIAAQYMDIPETGLLPAKEN
ncbi:MAG: hypothetical protein IJH87_03470 [Atopobiaceae bacterium]|nr:hypothetical protein [Atopobiaceae bacterium]